MKNRVLIGIRGGCLEYVKADRPECREDYYCLSCVPGAHTDLCDGHGGVI